MKPDLFLDAMGNIRSEWVQDAEQAGKSTPLWLRWCSIAACFCCVILLGAISLFRLSGKQPASSVTQPFVSFAAVSQPPAPTPSPQETDPAKDGDSAAEEESVAEEEPSAVPVPDADSGLLTSEKTGLMLSVPAQYSGEIAVDSSFTHFFPESSETITQDTVFAFYDHNSQSAEGLVWAISVHDRAQWESSQSDESSGLIYIMNETPLGRIGDTVYALLWFSPVASDRGDAQVDLSSRADMLSYYQHMRAGLGMLEDFVARNQLESSENWPSWRQQYEDHLLAPLVRQLDTLCLTQVTSQTSMTTVLEAAAYDTASALRMTDSKFGLTLEVPKEFSGEVTANSDEQTVFELYDSVSRDAGYDGDLWSIEAVPREDDADPNSLPESGMYLASAANYRYILRTPSDVRYAPDNTESVESYYRHWLHGYAMLRDFITRNDLDVASNWEETYVQELMSLSRLSGAFYTTSFDFGVMSATEPLQMAAGLIPNLSAYYTGSYVAADTLTWDDLLLCRLIFAEYDAQSDAAAELLAQPKKDLLALSREYVDPAYDVPEESWNQLKMAFRLFYALRQYDAPEELCLLEHWSITAQDDIWTLRAANDDGSSKLVISVAENDPLRS